MPATERLQILSLGNRVGGIARPKGSPAVFVRGALPGEVVRARALTTKRNYTEAELVSIERPSPHRTTPFCQHYGLCGGCSLQHLDYSEQLRWKRVWVEKATASLRAPQIDPVIPSPVTRGYRNRVTFGVSAGQLTLHAFRGDPVPVSTCPLMNHRSQQALRSFMDTPLPDGISSLCLRGATNTPTSLIEAVGSFDKKLSAKSPPVYLNKKGHWKHIKAGILFEKLLKFSFIIPPGVFFQVNTKAAELLVGIVLNLVGENRDSVLDLYGGVGTFSVPLADAGCEVTSVEVDKAASNACTTAVRLNHIPVQKLHPINSKVRTFLNGAVRENKRFHTVISDPPRTGMGVPVCEQILRLEPHQIIYISCNPFSAGRDLSVLTGEGYSIHHITPLDMFPHTDHVETVFFLKRS